MLYTQYGVSKYGLQKYAAELDASGQNDARWVDLAQYAPEFLAEIRELKEIYWTEGFEVARLEDDIKDAFAQTSISTATWGLLRWEEIFGIETNLQLSYEQRREALYIKKNSHGTATPRFIREGVESLCGGEARVIEYNGEYRFVVRFIGIKGIPRNMGSIINFLETVKPAHLAYSFEYRYTTWDEITNLTWGGVSVHTWDEIATMTEV